MFPCSNRTEKKSEFLLRLKNVYVVTNFVLQFDMVFQFRFSAKAHAAHDTLNYFEEI